MKLALALLVVVACGGKQTTGGGTAHDAVFKIKSNVANANLFVDGRYIGPVGVFRGGLAVVPGKHRIELRHEDYFSAYVEITLAHAEKRELDIDLAPVLP